MPEFGLPINCYFQSHDCGTVTIKLAFFEVTWQQAYKQRKESIIDAPVSMFRLEGLVVSGEEEAKV